MGETTKQLLEDIGVVLASGFQYGLLPFTSFFIIGSEMVNSIPSVVEWPGIFGLLGAFALFFLAMGCWALAVQFVVATANAIYDLDYHPVAKAIGYLFIFSTMAMTLSITL